MVCTVGLGCRRVACCLIFLIFEAFFARVVVEICGCGKLSVAGAAAASLAAHQGGSGLGLHSAAGHTSYASLGRRVSDGPGR